MSVLSVLSVLSDNPYKVHLLLYSLSEIHHLEASGDYLYGASQNPQNLQNRRGMNRGLGASRRGHPPVRHERRGPCAERC